MENINTVERLYENSPVGVVLLSKSFEPVYVNKAAKETYPLLSRPDGMKSLIPEEKRAEIIARLEEKGGVSIRAYDPHYSGTALNITEISAGEMYLLHFTKSMGFCEENVQSEEFMAIESVCRSALSEVFASLTPVSQILQNCGAYEDLGYIDSISNSCYRILRTVTDLTEYNRLTSAEPGLKKQGINLKEMLSDIGSLASTLARSEGVKINVKTEDCENIFVLGDYDRIVYAVSHLISNAIKYTREGNEVTISLKRVGSYAQITVSDKGIGISREIMPHIFKPFFCYSPMEIPFSSVGLGLTIVKLVAELSGGSVLIQSEENSGTIVSFSIPVADDAEDTVMVKNTTQILNRFSKVYVGLAGACKYKNMF